MLQASGLKRTCQEQSVPWDTRYASKPAGMLKASGLKRTQAFAAIVRPGKAWVRLRPLALSIPAGLEAYLVSQGTVWSWQARLGPLA
jgi:hypothetical protein